MHRKLFSIFSLVLVMIVTVSAVGPAMAAPPAPGSFDPNSVITIDEPTYLPYGLSNTVIDVVVRLRGQSVAEAQASLGRKLNKNERDGIVSSLKANQDALQGAIANAGGQVMNQFQYALNGIRVRINVNKAAQLASLPGVIDVLRVQMYTVDNATSVPYIGAPAVWDAGTAPNLHGEGIKIGIIDTGIDYTHANFAGPGTSAAYEAAHANETAPADPSLFGPDAPKVKGGYDLVGDDYNANVADSVPVPDPNPLDCNGHGSHVAGTAAGFGVNADGTTYSGPYNSSIYTPGAFRIGPGVAPEADLYAIRVFGCAGSTNVVVEAIEWAVQNDMDVINMSLGSPFGAANTADAVAADNATHAGMIVVTSAGNSGPNPYIVGSPSSATGAISVAANDSYPSFLGATLTFNGISISAINANGATFANGTQYTIVTIVNNPATPADESLGCSVSDYGSLPPNALAVVVRGTCARVAKAIFGQQAGAAAVAMVNNATTLPPYEGPIFSNPDDGVPYTVTIPFFGVRGLATTATSDGAKLRAASGSTVTAVNAPIANPGFSAIASFSSGGPRIGDSNLKPEITAPGVSTFSTAVGTGNQGEYLSGTSMAAPHVAGVAALVKQAHPDWTEEDLKAAIVNTGNPGAVAGYATRLAGTGLVQPYAAVLTNAVAMGGQHGEIAVNFGFNELQDNFSQSREIAVYNYNSTSVTFNISVTNQNGVPHTMTPLATSVTVAAGGEATVGLTLNVPAATAGNSNGFRNAAGIVTLTPVGGGNNGMVLRVPYYLVPRPLAALTAKSPFSTVKASSPSTTVTVTNKGNAMISGNADFYAWGLHSPSMPGQTTNDVQDVGVQVFQDAGGAGNPLIVFGVSTYNRWSTPVANEFDIYVDVDPQNNNGDDYIVIGYDYGALTTGTFNGQYGTFVYSLRSGSLTALNPANTFAPTDSASASLVILGSQLCRSGQPCLNSASNPRFTYSVVSFDILGTAVDVVPGVAKFNAFSPSITTGDYLSVAPKTSVSTSISISPAEWAQTPALGVLILAAENKSSDEALEVPLTLK